MTFRAEINVMPHKELLDPQGKAVLHGLQKMGFNGTEDVRVGKHISLTLHAANAEDARAQAEEACKKLLTNPIMEGYSIEIVAQ